MRDETILLVRALLGVLLAIAFHGWGCLGKRLLSRIGASTGAHAGSVGVAIVLVIGGVLNLLQLLVPATYLALIVVGLAGSAAEFFIRRSIDWRWFVATLVVLAAAWPTYFASLKSVDFNSHDDHYAYLVMPQRIAQLGTLQSDAFSYRTVVAGPGGIAFLQAPLVRHVGFDAIRLLDQGTGVLLLIGAGLQLCRRAGVNVVAGVVLVGGTIVGVSHEIVNVTSYFLTLSMLVALVDIYWNEPHDQAGRLLGAGLIIAGITVLKTTAVPVIGLIFLIMLANAIHKRVEMRQLAVAIGVPLLIVILWYIPWLRTPVELIPLRHGDGPDAVSVRYLLWLMSTSAWHWVYLVVFAAIALTAAMRAGQRRVHLAALVMVTLIANAVLTHRTGGVGLTRHMQPLFLPTTLLAGAIIVGSFQAQVLAICATLAIGGAFLAFQSPAPRNPAFLDYSRAYALQATSRTFPDPDEIARVQRIQSSMSPGAKVLLRTSDPYLMDFARNRVHVVDFPRAASPPPGMPPAGNDDALVRYLRDQEIRYIAYDYHNEANFPKVVVEARLRLPEFTPWQRMWNRQVPEFQDQLQSISRQWPKIYDDGKTWVVDISPAADVAPMISKTAAPKLR